MTPSSKLKLEVVYCSSHCNASQWVELDHGATVRDAIEGSRFLERFAEIDLKTNKVGVYGQIVRLDTRLRVGDRVEIYRAITCDPETVPRRDLQSDEQKGAA